MLSRAKNVHVYQFITISYIVAVINVFAFKRSPKRVCFIVENKLVVVVMRPTLRRLGSLRVFYDAPADSQRAEDSDNSSTFCISRRLYGVSTHGAFNSCTRCPVLIIISRRLCPWIYVNAL